MLQHVNQTVNANFIFDNNVVVNDNILMRNPMINDVNLNLLNNNTVKLDEPIKIDGLIQLTGSVVSGGKSTYYSNDCFNSIKYRLKIS